MTPTSSPIARRGAVFGLGYVGSVTAACLSRAGHDVTGIDRDVYKVECINTGKAPFFEPGLEDVSIETVAAGRLRASTNVIEALAAADVPMICVGTPSDKSGNIGIDHL